MENKSIRKFIQNYGKKSAQKLEYLNLESKVVKAESFIEEYCRLTMVVSMLDTMLELVEGDVEAGTYYIRIKSSFLPPEKIKESGSSGTGTVKLVLNKQK